jgi:gamma-glutamyltranspeptidase/glutathione hydrolase
MREFRRLILLTLAVIAPVIVLEQVCRAGPAVGHRGIVATVDDIASRAGVEAMKKGGNAVDAAVAAALTLGVVNNYNAGIGGGCFILIRRANGEFVTIDGRETAPAAATRDMYIRNGHAETKLSQTGALASGTPGALAAYEEAIKLCGKLAFKEHLLAAAEIAQNGFPVSRRYAAALKETAADLARFEGSRAVFFKADGQVYSEGDTLKQPDLATTYRAIAEQGTGWFYGGPFAQGTAKWMRENHGIMTAADFTNYRAVLRKPISTTYRGYKVVSFPPPSSGGVHVLEILNILETRDLKALDPVEAVHFIAEAMKLAFADRAYWLGDPDFANVPRGLISKDYAYKLADGIRLDHATPVAGHGTPADAQADVFKKHTTHFSTADADGNWVACTATINTTFGSKVVIPGTGVVMNNEMDDFSIEPGVPNYFGLIGAGANAVAPGKRPLSSMSPAIILKDDKPVMSVGAAGGPTIISQTVLNIVNVLDFQMDIQSAIDKPRFHQQWQPDELRVERPMPPDILAGLEKRGHKLRVVGATGISQAIVRSPDGKGFIGAADPRGGGQAEGW